MSACLACLGGSVAGGTIGTALTALYYKHNKGRWRADTTVSCADKAPPEELRRLRRTASSATDADTRGARWLNSIIAILWPRIDKYIQNLLQGTIQEKINSKLPGPMKGSFVFQTVQLGSAIPRFGPLEVRDRETNVAVTEKVSYNEATNTKQIALDLGVDITTEMEVSMTLARVPLGVKRLVFRGVLTVCFQPPSEGPPFFGAVEIYFKNPPEIDLDFTGAANVIDTPGIAGYIRTSIVEVVANKFVLPNRLAIDMNTEDDVGDLDLRFPDPKGIIKLMVKSGKGLLAQDKPWFKGDPTSDPYVEVLASGAAHLTTPVVQKTVNPVWTTGNSVDVYVFEEDQVINFNLWDQDYGNDDSLGTIKSLPVKDFMKPSNGKAVDNTYPVNTSDVQDAGADETGSLTFSTEWLVLTGEGPTSNVQNYIYLSVKLDHAHHMPPSFTPPFVFKVSVCEFHVESKPSWPQPAVAVASVLADVAIALHGKKMDSREIAEVTDLTEEDVTLAIQQKHNPTHAAKLMEQAAKSRAQIQPHFEEAVTLLLPWNEDIKRETQVTLTLTDKKGKEVDKSSAITIGDIMDKKVKTKSQDGHADHLELEKGVCIVASFGTRWVKPA